VDPSQCVYFYYSPVISWLQTHWRHFPSWAVQCYTPWDQPPSSPGAMKDIYDSPNWKRYPLLAQRGNMGLILNTDGISMFEAGGYSLWPLVLLNANLPPKQRLDPGGTVKRREKREKRREEN
jgi:hypothetical protein